MQENIKIEMKIRNRAKIKYSLDCNDLVYWFTFIFPQNKMKSIQQEETKIIFINKMCIDMDSFQHTFQQINSVFLFPCFFFRVLYQTENVFQFIDAHSIAQCSRSSHEKLISIQQSYNIENNCSKTLTNSLIFSQFAFCYSLPIDPLT